MKPIILLKKIDSVKGQERMSGPDKIENQKLDPRGAVLPKFQVVVCDDQKAYLELFKEVLELAFEDEGEIELQLIPMLTASKLLSFDKWNDIRLAIIILNNVLFDENLYPDMSGPDRALALLRGLKQCSNCPIICLYGNPDSIEYKHLVKSAGADDCFRLPYDVNQLSSAIRSALSKIE